MTAALEGVSGQQYGPATLYPRERPGTHFTGGWLDPIAGLDGRKISSPLVFDPGTSNIEFLKKVKVIPLLARCGPGGG